MSNVACRMQGRYVACALCGIWGTLLSFLAMLSLASSSHSHIFLSYWVEVSFWRAAASEAFHVCLPLYERVACLAVTRSCFFFYIKRDLFEYFSRRLYPCDSELLNDGPLSFTAFAFVSHDIVENLDCVFLGQNNDHRSLRGVSWRRFVRLCQDKIRTDFTFSGITSKFYWYRLIGEVGSVVSKDNFSAWIRRDARFLKLRSIVRPFMT